jgi:hypothetical protein
MSVYPFIATAGPAAKAIHTEPELFRVAVAHDQREAELIQNLFLDAGTSSDVRRTRGFDVPEVLVDGPRDVLVPRSSVDAARYVLLRAGLDDRATMPPLTRRGRILFGLEGALAVVSALALIIGHVIG